MVLQFYQLRVVQQLICFVEEGSSDGPVGNLYE